MFHRRPQRRISRPFQSLPIGPRQALTEAARLKDDKRFAEAANIFLNLAEAASARGMDRRVAALQIEAADCLLQMDRDEEGFSILKHSLDRLAIHKMWKALHRTGEQAVVRLEQMNKGQLAAELRDLLEQILPDQPFSQVESTTAVHLARTSPVRTALPSKCPACGALLRSNEIEWINESYVECPYCGSSISFG